MDYFTHDEFDCKCGCGLSGHEMNSEFLRQLDMARAAAGVPFVITSGMRCKAHNEAEGGSETSSHLIGRAADIKAPAGSQRHAVVTGLVVAGFKRYGISEGFIHVDNDPKKPSPTLFLYS